MDEYVHLKQRIALLERCIKQLRPDEQELIELAFFKKRTLRELTAIMRLSKSGIEHRINSALDALAALFF